jgi:hypothetical protein
MSVRPSVIRFELLHRWEDAGRVDPTLLRGEQTALWALSGRLEDKHDGQIVMARTATPKAALIWRLTATNCLECQCAFG